MPFLVYLYSKSGWLNILESSKDVRTVKLVKTFPLDEVQPTTTTVEVKVILVSKLTVSKFLHLLFNHEGFVRIIYFNSIVPYFKELLYFFSQIVGSIIRISQNDISGWWTDHNYLWHLRMCLWELQSSTLQQIKVLGWKFKEQHHNLSWSHLK